MTDPTPGEHASARSDDEFARTTDDLPHSPEELPGGKQSVPQTPREPTPVAEGAGPGLRDGAVNPLEGEPDTD